MLDEHFLHGGAREIRVNRVLAELVEIGESVSEHRVSLVLRLDECLNFAFKFRHDVAEFGDGGFPFGGVFAFVSEERLQHRDERARIGDVRVQHFAAVLV